MPVRNKIDISTPEEQEAFTKKYTNDPDVLSGKADPNRDFNDIEKEGSDTSKTVAPHTTQNEIDKILEEYDLATLDAAIKSGDTSLFTLEDMIVARYVSTGHLPESVSEDFLEGPEAHPDLWEENVIDTFNYWRSNNSSMVTEYQALFDYIESQGSEGDFFQEIEDFLKEPIGTLGDKITDEITDEDDEDSEKGGHLQKTFDLFKVDDLKSVLALFMNSGNPGTALLFYFAYGLFPATRDVEDEAMEVYENAIDQMEDLNDQLGMIDSESPDAQLETQQIQNQMNVISSVISTMSQFFQELTRVRSELLETASGLSSGIARTNSTIAGNIR